MPKRSAPPGCYWRGSVLWARAGVAGREYRWSLRTGNVGIAARRREAGLAKLIAESHYGEIAVTYEDAFVAWARHLVGHVAPATATRYAVSLGRIEHHLRGRDIRAIDRGLIAAIVAERREAGVTTATIRRDLGALSSLLGFAEDEGWREGNPALERIRRLKERRDPIVLPSPADVAAVEALLPGNLRLLAETARLTGCRQSELVTALRGRVDHQRRQLTVIGKGNRLRVVDLSDAAWAVIARVPVALRCKWLFWHGDGLPYRNVASRFAGYVRAAQKAAQQEGRPFRPFRFHDLRHLYAVEWLKSGGSIYDLQQHLGHRSIKTTEIYLAYLTPAEAAAAKRGTAQNPAQLRRVGTGGAADTDEIS